jgi:ubiquinone/menaquinone biosynthesis C-methylase UbiE
MKKSQAILDAVLRDPRTGGDLARRDGYYESGDGKRYLASAGIPSLVHPEALSGDDQRWNRFYNLFAPFYEPVQGLVSRLILGESAAAAHQKVIGLIPIRRGSLLLEVSPGPGVFHRALRAVLGDDATLVSLDLSLSMLAQCRKRGDKQAILVHGNGQHLPFANDAFDCVFHFGGVNLFNDPDRALREFIRVTKKGGIVSWGDEGFAATYKAGLKRQILTRLNPGYLKPRPAIPSGVEEVRLHTVYGGLGYLVVARKI